MYKKTTTQHYKKAVNDLHPEIKHAFNTYNFQVRLGQSFIVQYLKSNGCVTETI